jgi:RimJ/RimL family protein N-acetyltransferase
MTTPTIETERLTLRSFRDDDLDAYFAIMDTPGVRASLHMPDDFDPTAAWFQMASWQGMWDLRGWGQWAVELRSTGELIGRAGTNWPARPDWPGLEVGWAFDPAHWGHGYATEAGEASVEWAFATHDVGELVSVILPENTASQAVARRLGFELREEKVLAFFPSMAHGIWVLPRPS